MTPFDTALREMVLQSVVLAYDAADAAYRETDGVDEGAASMIKTARDLLFAARLKLSDA